ncbi:putative lipoprotein [Spiroplasma clarkii]|uniref:hypothetical protein n=1 Tax=Spiroplasma clarkii TaxID=2139 RepID=UPI000B55BD16|nr:hypothetical protein [Spiroplasma clarkii]ARU91707.1 putative lipoprotein [Spiroplasma clarkii]
MELIVKKKLNAFRIIILAFLIITVLLFIISSFFDWQIAVIFAKGFNNKVSKIWIIFMDELGVYIFEPSVFVMFAIWWETFVLYQKKYAKNEFFNKHAWASYVFYIVCFILSAVFIYVQTLERFGNYDRGFGSSFDPKLLESISWRHWAYAVVRVIQVSLMLFGAYYCRYIFSKRKDVFTQEYWIDALKGIIYMIVMSLMILAVKWSLVDPSTMIIFFKYFKRNWSPGLHIWSKCYQMRCWCWWTRRCPLFWMMTTQWFLWKYEILI